MPGRPQGDQGNFLCCWQVVFVVDSGGFFCFVFNVSTKLASSFDKLEFRVNLVELFKDSGWISLQFTDVVAKPCILSCKLPPSSQYFLHPFS